MTGSTKGTDSDTRHKNKSFPFYVQSLVGHQMTNAEYSLNRDLANPLNQRVKSSTSINKLSGLTGVLEVLRNSYGLPLDASTREVMESKFHYDFSKVRIHADEKAATSAKKLDALAYTVGNNIIFGNGQYSPKTTYGRRLITHELTHVIQQRHVFDTNVTDVSRPQDQSEIEANDVSSKIIAGENFKVSQMINHPSLNRQILVGGGPSPMSSRSTRAITSSTIIGRPIARVTLFPHQLGSFDLIARAELVPPGETSQFAGFSNQWDAYTFALGESTIVAIMEDSSHHYHLYDTGRPGFGPNTRVQVSPYSQVGYGDMIRWVNMRLDYENSTESNRVWREEQTDAYQLWVFSEEVERGGRAAEATRLRRLAANAYKRLMMRTFDIRDSDIHIASDPSDYHPNMINFSLALGGSQEPESAGRGGIGHLSESRPHDAADPHPIIVFGPGAFRPESPIFTRMTFAHESTHLFHAERSVNLLNRWRSSNTRLTFRQWLNRQYRSKHISQQDFSLTTSLLSPPSFSDTQSLAYLRGFMAGYHILPTYWDEATIFSQLSSLSAHWILADQDIKQTVLDQLRSYYENQMDSAHRDRFRRYVTYFSTSGNEVTRPFYQRLISFIAM